MKPYEESRYAHQAKLLGDVYDYDDCHYFFVVVAVVVIIIIIIVR